jgi:hypothetical protein
MRKLVGRHAERTDTLARRLSGSVPPHHLLWLQQVAGNAATTQLVNTGGTLAPPLSQPMRAPGFPPPPGVSPMVVQRQKAFGLMTTPQSSGFAGMAVEFWKAHKSRTLAEFTAFLLDKIEVQLAANGVPQVETRVGPNVRKVAGGFRSSSWSIVIDAASVTGKPLTTTLDGIIADRAAELAGICYHEGRHAEQLFLIARLMATRDKEDAAAIERKLEIPAAIAKAAADPSAAPLRTETIPKIDQWFVTVVGRHADYQTWAETFRGYVENTVAILSAPGPDIAKIRVAWAELHPIVDSWKRVELPRIEAKQAMLAAISRPKIVDRQVVRDLRRIRAGLKQVIATEKALDGQLARLSKRAWRVFFGQQRPMTARQRAETAKRLELAYLKTDNAVRQLGLITTNAYENYPKEADAYLAQAAVSKSFLAKAKSPLVKR